MKKKLLYLLLLIFIIVGVIVFFIFLNRGKSEKKTNITSQRAENSMYNPNIEKKETIKTELQDGTLYSFSKEEIKADVVVGDNYFDTQINNMITNSSDYDGKIIEIEGFYLKSDLYNFVGRYSSNSLCPYCSGGYSYIEYIWEGEKIDLTEIDSWIKVIGTLEKGNDETSYYQDYYYIKAISVEVMNQRGQEDVEN